MKAGERKLVWLGDRNAPCTLIKKVNGGWIVKLDSGMIIGLVEEGESSLR